jgi:hypothetical protein
MQSNRVLKNIKLKRMNRSLFCMHLQVHEVVQGAVHDHHDLQVPHMSKDRNMKQFKKAMHA